MLTRLVSNSDLPAPASQILGLKACSTTSGKKNPNLLWRSDENAPHWFTGLNVGLQLEQSGEDGSVSLELGFEVSKPKALLVSLLSCACVSRCEL